MKQQQSIMLTHVFYVYRVYICFVFAPYALTLPEFYVNKDNVLFSMVTALYVCVYCNL